METTGVGTPGASVHGADEGRHLAGVARDRVSRELNERVGAVSVSLSDLASTMEHAFSGAATPLERRFARETARVARDISRRLDARPPDELLSEARRQLQTRPALAVAAFAALGFVGGRLLWGGREERP